MGFESFQVELRGGPAKAAQVEETIRRLPHARPDPEAVATSGSSYYTVEDGRHVIEVEVMTAPVKVSCRFTLCHPPSIDAAFLGLLRELMVRLGMEARIRDDVPPEHARGFPAAQFSEFVEVASRYIAKRRAEWVADFGPEQFPAKTPEVYQRLILPRCKPVTG